MDADALKLASRSIRQWTGAFAESGYFAREAHQRFEALGLGPPVGEWRDVVVGTPTTFHAARVAALGDVPTELACAVFPQMGPRAIAAAGERLRQVTSSSAGHRCETERSPGEPATASRTRARRHRGARG